MNIMKMNLKDSNIKYYHNLIDYVLKLKINLMKIILII